jgi:transcriptional regulator with XRE-family HTH domain
MSYGEVLEEARKKHGLSKAKLAAKSDLSAATIRRAENSERSLSIETLDKAADKLGLAVVIYLVPKPEVETSLA